MNYYEFDYSYPKSVIANSNIRIPFEPKGKEKEFKDALISEIKKLIPPNKKLLGDQILFALFKNKTNDYFDIENILFYNIGTGIFSTISSNGIIFEYPYEILQSEQWCNRYEYSIINVNRYHSYFTDKKVCEFEFEIDKIKTDMKPHDYWYAFHMGKVNTYSYEDKEKNHFGIDMEIHTPKSFNNIASVIKPMLDGIISSFHYYEKPDNETVNLENVAEGGRVAREFKADFVIGIGGGSPLDASKAVAVLAVNDIEPVELYKNVFENKPLPIVAIPTTAGTGSEVTPYSILTRNDMKTKMSFGNEDTFPKLAFIDSTYTESMSYETTVDTAIDALSHAMEGYLSKRSTPVSDVLALEAIKAFSECTKALIDNKIDFVVREKLLYVSMLGGMVISHTGTTIIHGLGYSLTYFKGIPHGRANGYFMREYLKYNYEAVGEKIDKILELFKVSSIDEFGDIIEKMIEKNFSLSIEEIRNYAALTMKQRSTSYNAREVDEKDLIEILEKTF
jgi:alcohol dehydrogenase class IV